MLDIEIYYFYIQSLLCLKKVQFSKFQTVFGQFLYLEKLGNSRSDAEHF